MGLGSKHVPAKCSESPEGYSVDKRAVASPEGYSVDKRAVASAYGPEFESQGPHKKPVMSMTPGLREAQSQG